MIKGRICKSDDNFKRAARAHQFKFRDEILKVAYDAKNPEVMLPPEVAKEGLIFYEGYRTSIKKTKEFNTTALFSNMLRSEHIPYNIFVPMKLDCLNTANLFNEIIGGGIARISDIEIEFAGKKERSEYLSDGTSFDAYVKYEANDGRTGAIGIEVKYTEGGYRLGKTEGEAIQKTDGAYKLKTEQSGYFYEGLDIKRFLTDNSLRQIWRNHILGYAMKSSDNIAYFHHMHLYPEGNTHFSKHALPKYKKLLTPKGKESFIDITYEKLFGLMRKYFVTDEQIRWIDYLQNRYIV